MSFDNILGLAEWQALRRSITNERDKALFQLAYSHGLKASEIAALRRRDVHLRSHRLYLRMRRRDSRHVQLLSQEIRDLRRWLRIHHDPTGPLFPSRNHQAISRRRLDTLMKTYCAAAGIARSKAYFGVLRATCAADLIDRGQEALLCYWLGLSDRREICRHFHSISSTAILPEKQL